MPDPALYHVNKRVRHEARLIPGRNVDTDNGPRACCVECDGEVVANGGGPVALRWGGIDGETLEYLGEHEGVDSR